MLKANFIVNGLSIDIKAFFQQNFYNPIVLGDNAPRRGRNSEEEGMYELFMAAPDVARKFKLPFSKLAGVARKLAVVWVVFGLSCGVPGIIILYSPQIAVWAKLIVLGMGVAYWAVGSYLYLKYAEVTIDL